MNGMVCKEFTIELVRGFFTVLQIGIFFFFFFIPNRDSLLRIYIAKDFTLISMQIAEKIWFKSINLQE